MTKTILSNIIKSEYNRQVSLDKNKWMSSSFEDVNKLKVNNSGKIGEILIYNICTQFNINKKMFKRNVSKGVYDILIKNKRIEIKTARVGNGKYNTFQHETLSNDGCDYYLFVDIKPNEYYITVLKKFDLNERCKITKSKATLRKNTSNVYKFNLSETMLKRGIQSGNTIKVSDKTSLEQVGLFLDRLIV